MRKYKGVYIDGAIIKSEAEAEAFIKRLAAERLKAMYEVFAHRPTVAMAQMCDEQEQRMIDYMGFTLEEVEAIELAAYKTA